MRLRQSLETPLQRLGHGFHGRRGPRGHCDHTGGDREQVLYAMIEFTQQQLALFLGHLEIVNIGACAVPARNLSTFVTHALCPSDHPAVLARVMAQPILHVIGVTRGKAVLPSRPGMGSVVGMEYLIPLRTIGQSFGHACVLVPTLVEIVVVSVWAGRPDHLIDRVHNGFEALLALPERRHGRGSFGDVRGLNEYAYRGAPSVGDRLKDEVDMPQLDLTVRKSKFYWDRFPLIGFAARIHTVEKIDKTLGLHFR